MEPYAYDKWVKRAGRASSGILAVAIVDVALFSALIDISQYLITSMFIWFRCGVEAEAS